MAKLHDSGDAGAPLWSIAESRLRIEVETLASLAPAVDARGANSTLQLACLQSVSPAVKSVNLTAAPDGVVSSVFRPYRFRTVGCLFPEGRAACEPLLDKPSYSTPAIIPPTNVSNRATGQHRFTRVRPPRDLVKLEDRLRLLLQPPLESLLAAESLQFAAKPFAYQLDGIAFLYPRHQAVLADEMGLGKTMQAITAVRLLAHHGQLRRVLLVCPKPLVTNWQREFALWAPELTVSTIDGNPTRRQWLWRRARDVVVIANYETVVRDCVDVCDPMNPYDLVILDEAQRIKNRDNLTNQVAAAIPRSRSWALTGTPIENSVEDLVGIFEFVAPGHVHATMKPRAIGRVASDYVLRRTKEQVLTDLPPKLFRDAEVELTAEQAASYHLAEEDGVVRLRELKHEITIQHVFELVLRLKQICNFDPTTGASSKLERLEADMEECAASGRKAIVFSQWVQTLTELRGRLSRFMPLEYHGQVPQRRRDAVIEQFRDEKNSHVMLMTYGAGSVGLNLQFANYVFLFDRWWNPAVEDQAINRAHRIGVKSPVTITRFLTLGTIEQRINEILEKKRELFDTVFGISISTPRSGLSREEVFSLFNLQSSVDETRDVA
jgi:SNF2 family DNA or RNA helicase